MKSIMSPEKEDQRWHRSITRSVLRKNISLWLEICLVLGDFRKTSDDARGRLHGRRRAELAQDRG